MGSFFINAKKTNKLCWKINSAGESLGLREGGGKTSSPDDQRGASMSRTVRTEGQKHREVKHSRSRTPSPLLRSNKNHERVNSSRSERKVVESKITLGVR